MDCAKDKAAQAIEPLFADRQTIERLLGVPENTLRQLAREYKVAAHKLGDEPQSKCVYLFADVKRWVESRPAPQWVKAGNKEVA